MASSGDVASSYDVFLSFCGQDTRNSFTDHLYDKLKDAGIRTFRDNEGVHKGEELEAEFKKAIEESRASVVVLSQNYATSSWCLDELLLIMKQRTNRNRFVLPVFYAVEPTDVRNQKGSFAIEVKSSPKWNDDKVSRWKKALTEVANLGGHVISGPETKHIAEIVNEINSKLALKLLSIPANVIGMETRAKNIDTWLKQAQSSVQVAAIYGMGGAGKTTLARYLYNLNKENFESSCFLQEIGKHKKQPNGLLKLQILLLSDVLGGVEQKISSDFEGTPRIVNALQSKKVLLVLDDIDDRSQLEGLLGTQPFTTQSKIIITTRLLGFSNWLENISWKYQMHPLELMNNQESLALFSYHALQSKIPTVGLEKLAEKLATYSGGNPLALKLLASDLFVSVEDTQRIDTIVKMWNNRLDSLNSLERDIDSRIQEILQTSFDSLPRRDDRELLLHVACFFVGEDVHYVQEILEDVCSAKFGMSTLIKRCLVTISESNKLMMHQLIQDMGRNIVRSTNLAERTRVWNDDESYHLLRDGDGSNNIEALSLDFRNLKAGIVPSALKRNSLVKMEKLKFLRLIYVEHSASFKGFSKLTNLRYLCWHGYGIFTIQSGMWMSRLVALDMTNSFLQKFEPPTVIYSLKFLNLSKSVLLSSICNLSRLPNLESLILSMCPILSHLGNTDLERLVTLNLSGCTRLWKDSRNKKPLFSLSRSLEHVLLGDNLFESLPGKIDLKMIRVLNLNSCRNLKSLLYLPRNLDTLYIDLCTSLEKITFESARYKLKSITYEGCTKLSEVQGLFKLVSIEKLSEADLGHMKWVKAFQHHKVDLVGDEITKFGSRDIQMLYEYGIRSIFLKATEDQCTANLPYLMSVRNVPHLTTGRRIQGLHVTFRYQILDEDKDNDRLALLAIIKIVKSTTKVHTWIYNPMVYCKPRDGEVVEWLSYWPIGNMLGADDTVSVNFFYEKEHMKVIGCGVALVCTDDRDAEIEENSENMKIKDEVEVIGGDLSEFEVTEGGYYLCRRDLFMPWETPDKLKMLFGDNIYDIDQHSQGWRKCRKPILKAPYIEPEIFRDTLLKAIFFTGLSNKIGIRQRMELMYNLGVPFVFNFKHPEMGRQLVISGSVDPVKAETHVTEFEKMAKIYQVEYVGSSSSWLSYFKLYGYNMRHPHKLYCTCSH